MPAVNEKTSAEWLSAIESLTARRAALDEEVAALGKQRSALSLDAALNVTGAAAKVAAISADVAKKSAARDNLVDALAGAQCRLADARKTEAEAADRARREQIGAAMSQYAAAVQRIDDALRVLAMRFVESRGALDAAEALMVGTEAQPLQQLRSAFGATLAAADAGLGPFIELGPSSQHIRHRQPLSQFVVPFCDRWLQKEGEATNGN